MSPDVVVIFLSLFFFTYILEDPAVYLALVLIAEGKIRNTFAKQIVDEKLILAEDVAPLDGEGQFFIYRDNFILPPIRPLSC